MEMCGELESWTITGNRTGSRLIQLIRGEGFKPCAGLLKEVRTDGWEIIGSKSSTSIVISLILGDFGVVLLA